MADRLHVFGIRHHGPGSAFSVLRELEQLSPEEVLIEGPPEAEPLLPFTIAGLRPPVALLLHAHDDPANGSFFPFAEWSPEWVAMQWAQRRRVPVRLIDMPAAHRLTLPPRDHGGRPDPLVHLARLAGYEDVEAWWNGLVEERQPTSGSMFPALEQAMSALREAAADGWLPEPVEDPTATPEAEGPEVPDRLGPSSAHGDSDEREGPSEDWVEARREAFMRKGVRAALSRTEGPVAVVVGAWHAPAVRPDGFTKVADRKLLSGLAKVKVAATWVPWSDRRLTFASGYGAGVTAPGWYRTLWGARAHEPQGVSARRLATLWQVRVARVLRSKDLASAPSSVIDAVRLTEHLAAIRGLSMPGLPELRDASLATLCFGEDDRWRVVEDALLVGQRIGEVPASVPQMPLAADLARQQKKLRLKPEDERRELSLDLRTKSGRGRSVLLHRLLRIDVPWGMEADSGGSRGTFREKWSLQWDPELSIRLADALRWGSTIEAAATARTIHETESSSSLEEIAKRVRASLMADLPDASARGVRRLQEVSATGADVPSICRAVPPLVDILRYGTARELPAEGLNDLVQGLIDKTHVGLQHATRNLDAAAAESMHATLVAYDRAIGLHRDGAYQGAWWAALARAAEDEEGTPRIQGFGSRRLKDVGHWSEGRVERMLASILSPGVALTRAAGWLEGFLGDAGQILLHDPKLFRLVDQWLVSLDEDGLMEALPLMRRASSKFTPGERRQLLEHVQGLRQRADADVLDVDLQAFRRGEALLDTILGIE